MKQSGMTLIEVLITMAIIMVLASVAMPLSRVSSKRAQELELHQALRDVRAAIDAFNQDWRREGDVLIGPLCVKNKLSCKEATGVTGYPKSLKTLLEVKLSGEEATVRGVTVKRYLRRIPLDPMTGRADWQARCHSDAPDASSWCGDDVFDLASSSPGAALDGTKYRDW